MRAGPARTMVMKRDATPVAIAAARDATEQSVTIGWKEQCPHTAPAIITTSFFTLPHELNPIWHFNRSWCSDKLFKGGLGDIARVVERRALSGYRGRHAGVAAYLGKNAEFHPHVLLTGGGLNKSGEWKSVKNDFCCRLGIESEVSWQAVAG